MVARGRSEGLGFLTTMSHNALAVRYLRRQTFRMASVATMASSAANSASQRISSRGIPPYTCSVWRSTAAVKTAAMTIIIKCLSRKDRGSHIRLPPICRIAVARVPPRPRRREIPTASPIFESRRHTHCLATLELDFILESWLVNLDSDQQKQIRVVRAI